MTRQDRDQSARVKVLVAQVIDPRDADAPGCEALLEHSDFAGLRVLVEIAGDGRVVHWEVASKRLLAQELLGEPNPEDPSWGMDEPITATRMRQMPFGEMERAARAQIRRLYGDLDSVKATGDLSPEELRKLASAARALGDERRGRLKGPLGDEFYATVAKAYADSESPTPVDAVAALLHYGRNTVANWLTEARKRGLLSPTTRGRSGGVLTAKGKQVLENATSGGAK